MKVFICLDDKCGMLFNKRRQSRDRLVIENIEKHLCGDELHVNSYTETLLKKSGIRYTVSESPLGDCDTGDFCFIENLPLAPYESLIEELIIYRWNRSYPSDTRFDLYINKYELISSEEFAGSSHEKITKEVWRAK